MNFHSKLNTMKKPNRKILEALEKLYNQYNKTQETISGLLDNAVTDERTFKEVNDIYGKIQNQFTEFSQLKIEIDKKISGV